MLRIAILLLNPLKCQIFQPQILYFWKKIFDKLKFGGGGGGAVNPSLPRRHCTCELFFPSVQLSGSLQ